MKSKAGTPKRVALCARPYRQPISGPDLSGDEVLRILWELRGRNDVPSLQDAAQTNPSLLNTRLGELRAAQLIGHEGEGYLLTPSGRALLVALRPLAEWASDWRNGDVLNEQGR
jgi:DNA-binding HxlR family transcriptional regulator